MDHIRARYMAAPQVLDRALAYANILPAAEAYALLNDLVEKYIGDEPRLFQVARTQVSLCAPDALQSMRLVYAFKKKNAKAAAEAILPLLFDSLPINLSANSSPDELDELETTFREVKRLYEELVATGRTPSKNSLVGAYRGLGLIYSLRDDSQKSIQYLRKATEVDQANTTAFPDLVAELFRASLPAEPVVVAALARTPLNPVLHVLLGICKGVNNDRDAARQAFFHALDIDVNCHAAHGMLANEFLESGDFAAAKEHALMAVALSDIGIQRIGFGNFDTYENLLGHVLRALGDPVGAEEWYMKGLRMSESEGTDRKILARAWCDIAEMRARQNADYACFAAYFTAYVLDGHGDSILDVGLRILAGSPEYVVMPNLDECPAPLSRVISARVTRGDFEGAHYFLRRTLKPGSPVDIWKCFAAVQAELNDVSLVVTVAVLSMKFIDYRPKAVFLIQQLETSWQTHRTECRELARKKRREEIRAELVRSEVADVLTFMVRTVAQTVKAENLVFLSATVAERLETCNCGAPKNWVCPICAVAICSTECDDVHFDTRDVFGCGTRACASCHHLARYKCLCKTRYCDAICQAAAWPAHKLSCC